MHSKTYLAIAISFILATGLGIIPQANSQETSNLNAKNNRQQIESVNQPNGCVRIGGVRICT